MADKPKYDVDQETRDLLEAALNMVAQTSCLQLTEESADGLIALCDDLADRFGIDSHEIEVREADVDVEEPRLITVYRTPRNTTRAPKFRVIDGDKMDDTPPDDDDQLH